MKRQRGVVFILFVVVLALIGVVMVMGASTLQAQGASNRAGADRQNYLNESARQLKGWYQAHLATVDANVDAPALTTIVSEAGLQDRFGVHIAVSNRLFAGDIGYRVFAIWIPLSTPDSSVFDAATGQFTPAANVQYVMVSGLEMQTAAMAETRRIMSNAVVSLENYFAAKYELAGRDVSINQFRPDAACAGATAGLPCIDTYAVATGIDWSTTGLSGASLVDAWGRSLEVSNLQDSQTANPPYSMSLRSSTPFGTFLTMSAIQRL